MGVKIQHNDAGAKDVTLTFIDVQNTWDLLFLNEKGLNFNKFKT